MAAGRPRIRRRGHGRLRLHAAAVAAVPATGGGRGCVCRRRKPTGVRGVDVIRARIDPGGRARLKGLQAVSATPAEDAYPHTANTTQQQPSAAHIAHRGEGPVPPLPATPSDPARRVR
jgi:hypothetical protein